MQSYRLDGSYFQSPESMHEHLLTQFAFPSYYGKNLDAFWDCISERRSGSICIENVKAADPELFLPFFNVLMDLCRSYEGWNVEVFLNKKKKCFLSGLFNK